MLYDDKAFQKELLNEFLEDIHELCLKHGLVASGGGNLFGDEEGTRRLVVTFRREDELEPSDGSDVSEGSEGGQSTSIG